jgi:hypothetical protein
MLSRDSSIPHEHFQSFYRAIIMVACVLLQLQG